ncbi:YagK/YfjJ domain-containing protein [Vibrio cholerae]|uniref:YagK/YfjJ domain-containing protein n=1 Tax=Vibrio cholerae TaxID=666 RepID=UPI000E0B3B17|nr:inovirus-type Gp2 protein [Vibrio cholerae]ELY2118032.1 inovirus Gp2 family protein [Vibrio parahaemolyticus]
MSEESYQGSLFYGLPINTKHSMSERYLDRAHTVYRDAVSRYSKVFMFHVTLRFPLGYQDKLGNVITAFTRSLRERIQRDLDRKRLRVARVHHTDLHYVWCREVSDNHREHYHVMVMVNANTYRALGSFSESIQNQLASMIRLSWASAIGISPDRVRGLVHFASDVQLISARQIPAEHQSTKYNTCGNSYEAGFFWLSYLCKLSTKEREIGKRNFGYSSINQKGLLALF